LKKENFPLYLKKFLEVRMFEEPINVTDAAFEKTVLENELPVIADFWAP